MVWCRHPVAVPHPNCQPQKEKPPMTDDKKEKLNLRFAPKGAKAPVVPREPRVIDVTPTWRGLLPLYLAAHESGSFNAVKEAETELYRMADLADIYVKLAKHSPDVVRQLLDQIKVE
jgi:predicted DNA-binding protein (UPF0251 family)